MILLRSHWKMRQFKMFFLWIWMSVGDLNSNVKSFFSLQQFSLLSLWTVAVVVVFCTLYAIKFIFAKRKIYIKIKQIDREWMQATASSHVVLLKRIPKKCIRCRYKAMAVICSILGVPKAEEYSKTESCCGFKGV